MKIQRVRLGNLLDAGNMVLMRAKADRLHVGGLGNVMERSGHVSET